MVVRAIAIRVALLKINSHFTTSLTFMSHFDMLYLLTLTRIDTCGGHP